MPANWEFTGALSSRITFDDAEGRIAVIVQLDGPDNAATRIERVMRRLTMQFGTAVEVNPLAVNTQLSVEHGLGGIPDGVSGYLECLVVDNGYAVGDRIPVQVPWQIVFSYNATHVHVSTVDISDFFDIVAKGAGTKSGPTLASWKLVGIPFRVG